MRLLILALDTFVTRLFFLFALLLSSPAWAQDDGFKTPAPHAIIMDYDTGVILFEKDARRPIAPASMTKIMTAEMIFDQLRSGAITLDTEFPVSEEAWRRGGAKSGSSTMFLDLNSSVRVEDLLRGVIIQSGNDACIVLAEGIAGSETAFADMMTEHARKIGLKSATFRNSTGWPHPDHNISLLDLAKLAQRTIRDYAEFYPIYAERSFKWNGITQGNRNPLLGRFTGADGLKTGHTEASGYGLVASAKRGDQRRIVVVNGLDSKAQRRDESLRLMQAAFDQFKVYDLFAQDEKVHSVPVFMGRQDKVEAQAFGDIKVGLARDEFNSIKLRVKSKETIAAPIAKGEHVADLIVSVPGRADQVYPLHAGSDVKRKSAFGRAMSALAGIIRG